MGLIHAAAPLTCEEAGPEEHSAALDSGLQLSRSPLRTQNRLVSSLCSYTFWPESLLSFPIGLLIGAHLQMGYLKTLIFPKQLSEKEIQMLAMSGLGRTLPPPLVTWARLQAPLQGTQPCLEWRRLLGLSLTPGPQPNR